MTPTGFTIDIRITGVYNAQNGENIQQQMEEIVQHAVEAFTDNLFGHAEPARTRVSVQMEGWTRDKDIP